MLYSVLELFKYILFAFKKQCNILQTLRGQYLVKASALRQMSWPSIFALPLTVSISLNKLLNLSVFYFSQS